MVEESDGVSNLKSILGSKGRTSSHIRTLTQTNRQVHTLHVRYDASRLKTTAPVRATKMEKIRSISVTCRSSDNQKLDPRMCCYSRDTLQKNDLIILESQTTVSESRDQKMLMHVDGQGVTTPGGCLHSLDAGRVFVRSR